ncbi:IS3 family transposase [Nocardia abscessus]|uniref:IS3 family transposase n=1 Tax=Nocardia abscessus TaxID=120957 RepID=UPI003A5CD61A
MGCHTNRSPDSPGRFNWYNNARLHSRLDYLTPAEYEATYYAQQPPRRPARV